MNATRSVFVWMALLAVPAAAQRQAPACAPDNAGLELAAGFCTAIVADSLGPIRHFVVAPNGDVFATRRATRQDPTSGGVLALRDTDGDGRLEVRGRFGPGSGSGIALHGGHLYFATDDAVVRWPWKDGQLEPAGAPDTVAHGLLNRGRHGSKGITIGPGNALYVNIGAPSNVCEEGREAGSAGSASPDPCPQLENAGGIWRFAADGKGQTQAQGERFATGLRNTWALAVEPSTGALYGMQHGRDDLHRLWPALFTEAQSAEKPAEELVRIERGADYGWPYCYHDPELKQMVLAPEYGGDGKTVGRCASARGPEVAFPAHWAPNGLLFYTSTQFPAAYRGGAFIAFHGSWNRSPVQAGYNVTFVPFGAGKPAGPFEVFARGFAGGEVRASQDAAHRPTGLALGADGSLYVGDDRGGRIYRIFYRP